MSLHLYVGFVPYHEVIKSMACVLREYQGLDSFALFFFFAIVIEGKDSQFNVLFKLPDHLL